ncbi:restriction endonuclease subunit S [Rhodococcus sp. IEGM 1406]|uniref:restriction endonuclease subunit S n=1 Tax=Rhodococcus sp. IEGM 1406 TaxID=3047083 RepID=UPI0024B78F69|nr:restriction endonuclease subunit S [Rhodococcus sp. IEGM 1406]MDI9907983.1 restriction endonuclease subunit S [Rhodococcus sp. IEGM 1406]
MNWPSYPKYFKSGVEWIGDAPSHWKIRQLKWGNPVKRGASPRPIDDPKYFDDDGEWSWVRIADVSASSGRLRETQQKLSEVGSSLSVKLSPGSLFISIAGTVGKPCITEIPACIHDGFVYFPNLDIDAEFLFHVFEAGQCYQGLGKFGTQLNLNTDTIGSIRIPIPGHSEQRAIVDFLKCEISKIDGLIRKQLQLIEMLREDRTSTVTNAVTRGLNPHIATKNPEENTLSYIPPSWKRQKLAWNFHFLNGDRGSNYPSPSEILDEGVPFINAGHLQDGKVNFSSMNYVSDEKYATMGGAKLKTGDILYCLRGSLGKNAMVDSLSKGSLASSLVALRNRNPSAIHSRFVFWLLNSGAEESQRSILSSGSAQPNMSVEDLGGFVFGIPSIDEQIQITLYLDQISVKIDSLIAKAEEMIETLNEYRSALITAAVTGKIDVRGVA